MATKAQDTFTEGANTNLNVHTPDTGTSWSETTNGNHIVRSGSDTVRREANGGSVDIARENTDIGDADMDVSVDLANVAWDEGDGVDQTYFVWDE